MRISLGSVKPLAVAMAMAFAFGADGAQAAKSTDKQASKLCEKVVNRLLHNKELRTMFFKEAERVKQEIDAIKETMHYISANNFNSDKTLKGSGKQADEERKPSRARPLNKVSVPFK